MFERFTERARQVVVLAQEEARLLGHDYIGTEHLLLGLLREEEGLAARILESLAVTLDDVRERVTRIVGLGEAAQTGQIPFTPRAKKVLELSLREALGLGHEFIGTEHLLLGLTRDVDGVAAQILRELGLDGERIRGQVTETLGTTTPPIAPAGAELHARSWPRSLPGRLREQRRPKWWQSPQVAFLLGALVLAAGVLIGWAIAH
jgi:ATP-dependent Clp protease ATP-binding subunit ClpA